MTAETATFLLRFQSPYLASAHLSLYLTSEGRVIARGCGALTF